MEYSGSGVKSLSVPERATITNMGAELGATTSIFPSDEQTKKYLTAQKRGKNWVKLEPDADATYDAVTVIDLNKLEPMIAKPHNPDNVVKVKSLRGVKVNQVAVGSCTNSSYRDLMTVAKMLKGKTIHPDVSMAISPGSKQVFEMISKNGALTDILDAGARILESACGPCIGMGFAPRSGGVSVRSFNRNFTGRSGTKDAKVYLSSPETAVACALTGKITDPRKLGIRQPKIAWPKTFLVNDNMIIPPTRKKVEVVRGPNIKPLPVKEKLSKKVAGEVLLKTGDNITTDHIMPAGARVLPFRSNVPAISEFVFEVIDPTFPERAKKAKGGLVIGGHNYGQGSSREHAALAPMYLGVKAVVVKSFARIHKANLVNFGIVPLTFVNEKDYDKIHQGDKLSLTLDGLKGNRLTLRNETRKVDIEVELALDERAKKILKAGGALGYARQSK